MQDQTTPRQITMPRSLFIFSLLYGADPNRFIFVEKFIPQQRLKRALRDNARKQRSWERLLAPHVRS